MACNDNQHNNINNNNVDPNDNVFIGNFDVFDYEDIYHIDDHVTDLVVNDDDLCHIDVHVINFVFNGNFDVINLDSNDNDFTDDFDVFGNGDICHIDVHVINFVFNGNFDVINLDSNDNDFTDDFDVFGNGDICHIDVHVIDFVFNGNFDHHVFNGSNRGTGGCCHVVGRRDGGHCCIGRCK